MFSIITTPGGMHTFFVFTGSDDKILDNYALRTINIKLSYSFRVKTACAANDAPFRALGSDKLCTILNSHYLDPLYRTLAIPCETSQQASLLCCYCLTGSN